MISDIQNLSRSVLTAELAGPDLSGLVVVDNRIIRFEAAVVKILWGLQRQARTGSLQNKK
jgi:hypothetical protein